jgi:ketosteroid isomerase-like protein
MSEENVELTYRAFDAFNRRDFDALVGLMDDDVENLLASGPLSKVATTWLAGLRSRLLC